VSRRGLLAVSFTAADVREMNDSFGAVAREHRLDTYKRDVKLVKTAARDYRVDYQGTPIGTIKPMTEMQTLHLVAQAGDWGAQLLGYDNFTWIGKGLLREIAMALIDHELDQRETNPARKGTQSPYRLGGPRPEQAEEPPAA